MKEKSKKFDFSQGDWWYAEHFQNRLKGYVPALYVAADGGLDVHE